MKQIQSKHFRILAVSPSTRGFGFAVLENEEGLVDWGVRTAKGNKNAQCLIKLDKMIDEYVPNIVVIEDYFAKDSRRSFRVKALGKEIVAKATERKLKVKSFTRTQMNRIVFNIKQLTKDARAEILAEKFPEELGARVPKKRRTWMSESYQMAIFDAVALALAAVSPKKQNKLRQLIRLAPDKIFAENSSKANR